MTPFDFVNDILYKKQNIMTPENEGDYNSFVVNRSLSNHRDCILQVNEMNTRGGLSKRMQYDFLLGIVRPFKRKFVKWISKEKCEDIGVVMEYFNVSPQKAREILMIIGEGELDIIKEKINKGGLNGRSK